MSLAQLDVDPELPPEIFQTRTLRALINSAADAVGLINDVVSFRKEIEVEGELNNGVLVIRQFLDCSSQRAMDLTAELSAARIRQFEHVRATELPVLMAQFKLTPKAQDSLLRYVWTITNWVAGVPNWHFIVPRYTNLRVHPHPVTGASLPSSLPRFDGFQVRPQLKRERGQARPAAPAEPPSVRLPSGFTGLGTAAGRWNQSQERQPEPPHPAPGAAVLAQLSGIGTGAARLAALLREKSEPIKPLK